MSHGKSGTAAVEIKMILHQDENSASAALSTLIGGSSVAQSVFLQLILGEKPPSCYRGKPSIQHLYNTGIGCEFDLLIQFGRHALIIECKVRDSQKVYQLETYRNYWLRTHKTDPVLVWLVRQKQDIIGSERLNACTLTWNDLRDALKAAEREAPRNESLAIARFCAELEGAKVVRPSGASVTKKTLHKGYDPDFAVHVLSKIMEAVPGIEGEVHKINELPPALHVGRPEWRNKFGDSWFKRIWFYFEPETDANRSRGPFHFRGQILLYRVKDCDSPMPTPQLLAQWIAELTKHDLVPWRNQPGKWRHQELVVQPWTITPPVKHVFLEETVAVALQRSNFDWKDERDVLRVGAEHLRKFVQWVDSLR